MTRGSYSKARCRTCRARHLKCDGNQPACTRCIRTGRSCDGYQVVQRTPSSRLFDDEESCLSWEYFWLRTLPTMMGHHYQNFWQKLIPNLADSELTIRYALAAIGSLHRSWGANRMDYPNSFHLSLQQYNKAIRCLMEKNMPLLPSLVAAILFAQLQLVQLQNYQAGLEHLKSGLKIMQHMSHESEMESRTVSEHIFPIFNGYSSGMLDEIIAQDRDHANCLRWFRRRPPIVDYSFTPPKRFQDIGQARENLHSMLNEIFPRLETSHGRGDKLHTIQMIIEGQNQLHCCYRRLLTYLNCIARSPSEAFVRDASLLQIQHLVSTITLATVAYEDEMKFDKHISSFGEITRLCTGIMAQEAGSLMSFETGIIPALDFVAQRCRDPSIRHSAITLVDRISNPDGILSSHAAITVWNMITWVEEHNSSQRPLLCRDIPREARIRATNADFITDSSDASAQGHPHWQLTWRPADSNCATEMVAACFPISPRAIQGDGEQVQIPQSFEYKRGFAARSHEMYMPLKALWPRWGLSQPWAAGIDLRLF